MSCDWFQKFSKDLCKSFYLFILPSLLSPEKSFRCGNPQKVCLTVKLCLLEMYSGIQCLNTALVNKCQCGVKHRSLNHMPGMQCED